MQNDVTTSRNGPIFFQSSSEFEGWLDSHAKAASLWVGYHKKSANRPGMTWSESVDVALCYGWIDGIRRSIDPQAYMIRFTPRRPNSVWSAVNVEKVRSLIALNRMLPAGLEAFEHRKDPEGYSIPTRDAVLDKSLEAKLRADDHAWAFFSGLAPSYQRDSIWWVMSAKKRETRDRRLRVLITSSQQGLMIPQLR